MLSPKGWFGALGAGQGTPSPELCPPWLLVASALAALTPSPGSGADTGSWEAPGCRDGDSIGTRTRFPASHPKAARPRWEHELVPLQGEATAGMLRSGRDTTPGARPAVSAGEQRLCATSERSRRQNPTRRRRILHQPKDSGGAKPFAAAEEPSAPPRPLCYPK